MQKTKFLGVVLGVMLMVVGVAQGLSITEIGIAQAIPVSMDFDGSGAGILTFDHVVGAQATVTYGDSTTDIFQTVTVSSLHNLTTDTSSGGLASGIFDTGANAGLGSVTITLSNRLGGVPGLFPNPNSDVLGMTLTGTLDFFNLQENALQNATMNGEGVFTLTTNFVDSVSGIVWAAQDGKSVMRTTNASVSPDPDDLSLSFASSTGSMSLIASDPIIPEPASLALLSLGAIGLLKRRRQTIK